MACCGEEGVMDHYTELVVAGVALWGWDYAKAAGSRSKRSPGESIPWLSDDGKIMDDENNVRADVEP